MARSWAAPAYRRGHGNDGRPREHATCCIWLRSVTSPGREPGGRKPRSGLVFRRQSGGRGIRTHGDVAATMVSSALVTPCPAVLLTGLSAVALTTSPRSSRVYPVGHQPFRSVDTRVGIWARSDQSVTLGRIPARCSRESEELEGRSSAWLQRGSRPHMTRGTVTPWSSSPASDIRLTRGERALPCPDPSAEPDCCRAR